MGLIPASAISSRFAHRVEGRTLPTRLRMVPGALRRILYGLPADLWLATRPSDERADFGRSRVDLAWRF